MTSVSMRASVRAKLFAHVGVCTWAIRGHYVHLAGFRGSQNTVMMQTQLTSGCLHRRWLWSALVAAPTGPARLCHDRCNLVFTRLLFALQYPRRHANLFCMCIGGTSHVPAFVAA